MRRCGSLRTGSCRRPSRGGLRAGIDAVVKRLDLPVEVDVARERLPPEMEASAYFIVAEALTNAVKHAQATRAVVRAALDDGALLSGCATTDSAAPMRPATGWWA